MTWYCKDPGCDWTAETMEEACEHDRKMFHASYWSESA